MEMDVARGLAAQCWCDPRVSDREMDVELAEVFAEKLIEAWLGTEDFVAMVAKLTPDDRDKLASLH